MLSKYLISVLFVHFAVSVPVTGEQPSTCVPHTTTETKTVTFCPAGGPGPAGVTTSTTTIPGATVTPTITSTTLTGDGPTVTPGAPDKAKSTVTLTDQNGAVVTTEVSKPGDAGTVTPIASPTGGTTTTVDPKSLSSSSDTTAPSGNPSTTPAKDPRLWIVLGPDVTIPKFTEAVDSTGEEAVFAGPGIKPAVLDKSGTVAMHFTFKQSGVEYKHICTFSRVDAAKKQEDDRMFVFQVPTDKTVPIPQNGATKVICAPETAPSASQSPTSTPSRRANARIQLTLGPDLLIEKFKDETDKETSIGSFGGDKTTKTTLGDPITGSEISWAVKYGAEKKEATCEVTRSNPTTQQIDDVVKFEILTTNIANLDMSTGGLRLKCNAKDATTSPEARNADARIKLTLGTGMVIEKFKNAEDKEDKLTGPTPGTTRGDPDAKNPIKWTVKLPDKTETECEVTRSNPNVAETNKNIEFSLLESDKGNKDETKDKTRFKCTAQPSLSPTPSPTPTASGPAPKDTNARIKLRLGDLVWITNFSEINSGAEEKKELFSGPDDRVIKGDPVSDSQIKYDVEYGANGEQTETTCEIIRKEPNIAQNGEQIVEVKDFDAAGRVEKEFGALKLKCYPRL